MKGSVTRDSGILSRLMPREARANHVYLKPLTAARTTVIVDNQGIVVDNLGIGHEQTN